MCFVLPMGGSLGNITPAKVLIFVLGTVSLIFYLVSGLPFDYFFVHVMISFLVLTFVSIIFSFSLSSLKLVTFIDIVIHVLAAFFVFIAAIILLVDVTTTTTGVRQAKLGENVRLYYPTLQTGEILSWEALVAGIVAIVQSIFHLSMVILLAISMMRSRR